MKNWPKYKGVNINGKLGQFIKEKRYQWTSGGKHNMSTRRDHIYVVLVVLHTRTMYYVTRGNTMYVRTMCWLLTPYALLNPPRPPCRHWVVHE
jgi:hypothetical protein